MERNDNGKNYDRQGNRVTYKRESGREVGEQEILWIISRPVGDYLERDETFA